LSILQYFNRVEQDNSIPVGIRDGIAFHPCNLHQLIPISSYDPATERQGSIICPRSKELLPFPKLGATLFGQFSDRLHKRAPQFEPGGTEPTQGSNFLGG